MMVEMMKLVPGQAGANDPREHNLKINLYLILTITPRKKHYVVDSLQRLAEGWKLKTFAEKTAWGGEIICISNMKSNIKASIITNSWLIALWKCSCLSETENVFMAFPAAPSSGWGCECGRTLHTVYSSGDDGVGLIGQHLLSCTDCINPFRFDKIQIGVLHQRLRGSQSKSKKRSHVMYLHYKWSDRLRCKAFKTLQTIPKLQIQMLKKHANGWKP